MKKNKKDDIQTVKKVVNEKHIEFYDKTLSLLEYVLEVYSGELLGADFEEMSKNTLGTLDFLISSIGKIQKGHRLALGLDDEKPENIEPEINIIEGISEKKI